MAASAYIVDFTEPREIYEANRHIAKGQLLLSTKDTLETSAQVKVRLNFPDGNGLTIRGRVTQVLAGGAGYILKLPQGDDLAWLQEKAASYAARVEKVLKTAAPAPGPRTRVLGQRERQKAGRDAGQDETLTRRIPQTAVTGIEIPPAQTLPAAAGPASEDQGQGMADSLAPSERDLVRRVALADEMVAKQLSTGAPGRTIHATPLPDAHNLPPGDTQDIVKPGRPEADAERKAKAREAPPPSDAPPEPASREEQIRALTQNQKKKLAISGNREAREMLMREGDPSLHIWVMKNPNITEEEVEQYSRMESLGSEALNFILHNRKWGTSPRIVLNLALNPLTPPEAIPNLLQILPAAELKALVETPGIRHLVARQARRILMERSEI